MAEWYSWQDLLYRWNKKEFELLELIKKGLKPFTEYDNPISFQSIFSESGEKDAADEKAPSWSNMELPLSDTEAASAIELLKKAHFRRANVIDVELKTDLCKHTRPTFRWLNGNQLLEQWGIDEFELCKLIFEWGLPAYDSLTLRSIKTGSDPNNSIGDGETDRKDFGILISGTQEQKFEAMERLRFKPFEVDEFEEQNRNYFEKTKHQPTQDREISQAANPASVDKTQNNNHSAKESAQAASKELPRERHRRQTRAVAKRLWDEHPSMSVPEMIAHLDVLEAGKKTNDKYYADKTIKEWIKYLNPNPPLKGRPRKKDD